MLPATTPLVKSIPTCVIDIKQPVLHLSPSNQGHPEGYADKQHRLQLHCMCLQPIHVSTAYKSNMCDKINLCQVSASARYANCISRAL